MAHTIFALSTPYGKSGVAIIRVSGEQVQTIIRKICDKPEKISDRQAVLQKLHSPKTNSVIDNAIVLFFKAPYSYTGEDLIEFHVHGSYAVIKELLGVLSNFKNTKIAEPGEFSRRSFENGKMDLTQIEGLHDLINSETAKQKQIAIKQVAGSLENLCEKWRQEIILILANLEAYIDFPDEDLPADLNENILSSIIKLKENWQEYLKENIGEIIQDGIKIAILGKPNVGKSTLLNTLTKEDIAITSDIEGTTRDSIEVKIDVAGYPVTLIDTAGLRDAVDEIEKKGIERSLSKALVSDIKICMFDGEGYPNKDEKTEKLIDQDSIVVFNKVDKFSEREKKGLFISAKSGHGVDILIEKIKNRIEQKYPIPEHPLLTKKRHKNILQDALLCLDRFLDNNKSKLPIEILCEDLRLASYYIGKITGKIDVEEILDEIFGNFCIGK